MSVVCMGAELFRFHSKLRKVISTWGIMVKRFCRKTWLGRLNCGKFYLAKACPLLIITLMSCTCKHLCLILRCHRMHVQQALANHGYQAGALFHLYPVLFVPSRYIRALIGVGFFTRTFRWLLHQGIYIWLGHGCNIPKPTLTLKLW